ncbi:MAG TPA: hypothetical protein VEK84_07360 [Terriglobales bacterium]|nr:hypothetical protein [Terriglobales bacterium]
MRLRRRDTPRKFAVPSSTPPLPLIWVFLRLALFGGCQAVAVLAQETQPPPNSPGTTPSAQSDASVPRKRTPVALFVMLDKKSIVFPDIAADSARLSTGQKFKLFVDSGISLHTLAESSLGAAISQAADSPHGYGQGGDGYAKRFGSSMASGASSNFFGTFLLASAFHQDPRFFPERDPTFGRSVKYSLQRIFVTRDDEGRDVANWSGLMGPLLSEGLANAYWPEQDRTAGQTFQRYGIDLGVRLGGNMLREYWPVFFRKVRGSPRPQAQQK